MSEQLWSDDETSCLRPTTGESGHDHFFATFDKMAGTDKKHKSEWVDEAPSRVAAQNEQYLELMEGRLTSVLRRHYSNLKTTLEQAALRLVRAGTQEVPAAAHADRIRATR